MAERLRHLVEAIRDIESAPAPSADRVAGALARRQHLAAAYDQTAIEQAAERARVAHGDIGEEDWRAVLARSLAVPPAIGTS